MMTEDDMRKLRILLEHWIEHNISHSREFEKWAGKAERRGERAVSQSILEAVEHMERVNQSLHNALSEAKARGNP